MNLNTIIEKLRYPNKGSALRYLIENPSLLFTLGQDTSKLYFSNTMENILESNIVNCLYHFLPEEFSDHLASKKFIDDHGIEFLLYLLVRKYKPEIFIETGVAHGASSAFILCAMHQNKKGHLYSIDKPPYDTYVKTEKDAGSLVHVLEDGQKHVIKDDYMVGDLVPDYLKDRWTLISGDARAELPMLLKKLNKISVFFHDSLHTYEHMMFEYTTAWPYIHQQGFLISHDVLWNAAFKNFCNEVNANPSIYYSLGLIRKNR